MGRKKGNNQNDYNGRKFGQWLLSPKTKINCFVEYPNKKLQTKITKIRNDQSFIVKWEELWAWRDIRDKYARIMFFKIQCLERNSEAQRIKSQFGKDKGAFYEYAEKNWFIPQQILINYYSLFCFKNPVGEIFDTDADFLEYLRSKGSEISGDRRATKEVFSNADFLEYLRSKDPKAFQIFLFNLYVTPYSPGWDHDFKMLQTDRFYGDPTVYIRVDIRSTDKDIATNINRILKEKREEMNVHKSAYISGKSIELALMFYDLQKKGFTVNHIAELFQDFTGDDSMDVAKKLTLARKIIRNSTQRNFPF